MPPYIKLNPIIFRKIFLITLCLISEISDDESDYEKYRKLKAKNVASIQKSDLPKEFSAKAFEIVDEFIRKTIDLNYEILVYFDYIPGEILKCKNRR